MPEAQSGTSSAEPLLHLDLREGRQHLVGVSLRCTPRQRRFVFRLPAWTPGSYLIRDYVRTLEGLEVRQGVRALQPRRIGVAAWQLSLDEPLQPLEIRYRILATELSVRTCHLDGDHGFLALAGVVVQVEGERWNPHRLRLSLPAEWEAFVPLPRDPDGSWRAGDFDQLIDTPVEAGPHPWHDFPVAGVPHRWVTWGEDLPARDPAWLADVERVCLACCRLMGEERPAAADYLFVLHLREQGYGGLEHDGSTVLQYGRAALARPEGRRRLLQLVAHEYLHQWNVRRLRPAELAPIDYDAPAIIPSLWFAEGVTSYYDALLPQAAGCSGESELLEDLGEDLSRYLLTPGRRIQSLRDSSREAWVKLYRQDVHAPDNQISYYLKGAVLSLVLDLHLRRHGSCLALVLRRLWHSHGRMRRGYREQDLIEAFAAESGDLATLLPSWLEGLDDPDLSGYLGDVGLRLVPETAATLASGWQVEVGGGGSLLLRRVERHGAAQRAGLQAGDELLALDGERVRREEDLRSRLAAGGDCGARHREVLFCRDGRIRSTQLLPEAPAIERWRLTIAPESGPAAAEQRARWLSLEP